MPAGKAHEATQTHSAALTILPMSFLGVNDIENIL